MVTFRCRVAKWRPKMSGNCRRVWKFKDAVFVGYVASSSSVVCLYYVRDVSQVGKRTPAVVAALESQPTDSVLKDHVLVVVDS